MTRIPTTRRTPLTDITIKALKPEDAFYRVYDEKGLYLQINPNGSKLWRYKYRFQGKEKLLSFGPYPEVKLADARALRDHARKVLREGIDPGLLKKRNQADNAFQAIALEWLDIKATGWSASHISDTSQRLNNHVFPYIGEREITEINPPEILAVVRRLEERNTPELAKKVLMCCSQVFRYAVTIGKTSSDPCRDLKSVLKSHKAKPYPAITDPKKIGDMLLAIEGYRGQSNIVKYALKFSALTFGRPGEIRGALWSEINWDEAMWIIPAERMKNNEEHRVPLSSQSLEILSKMKVIAGMSRFIFPSIFSIHKPISLNTATKALQKLGYKGLMVAHGFRAMASTRLNELGYRPDIIEAQLSHKESDKVRAAYNRAQYMNERRQLLQDWADYLDKLYAEAKENEHKKLVEQPV